MTEDDTDGDLLHRRIRTQDWGEETLDVALHEIRRICREIGIEDEVSQVAEAIYRRALEKKVVENRSIAALSASAVYAATKSTKKAYSPSEIAKSSNVHRREINRTMTELKDQLNLTLGPVDPKKYISRYCDELDLPEETEMRAKQIIDEVEDEGHLSGRSPSGVAASAVYISCLITNHRITRSVVANVADVSKKTISDTYQLQFEILIEQGRFES